METFTTAQVERFWSGLNTPDRGCWEWQRTIYTNGYGDFRTKHRHYLAHRLAWRLVAGDIPVRMLVLHTCDNRSCCRVDDEGWYEINGVMRPRRGHLWLGTYADNMADMVAKGRQADGEKLSALLRVAAARGESHGTRTRPDAIRHGEKNGGKLSDETVLEMRRRYATGTIRQIDLAVEYDITRGNAHNILRGLTYTHLPLDGRFDRIDSAHVIG